MKTNLIICVFLKLISSLTCIELLNTVTKGLSTEPNDPTKPGLLGTLGLEKLDSIGGGGGGDSGLLWLLKTMSNQDTRTDDNGEKFIIEEGDIAIREEDFLDKTTRIISEWEGGSVTYSFHSSVTNITTKQIILDAMSQWELYTCVRFTEKMSLKSLFYIRFRTDSPGCYSFVGKQLKDVIVGQDVNLGKGCENLSTAIHEIGHVLGLSHEQMRMDRDEYLQVNYENIAPAYHGQFAKANTKNEVAEYDFLSVMQYPSWGFSVSPFHKITMSTVNPMLQYLIDEDRQGLTFKDIKAMNIIYKCSQKQCFGFTETACSNDGYLIPYKGQACRCMCPPGYTGQRCEFSVLGPDADDYNLRYYGGLRCGGNLTVPGDFATPGYPNRDVGRPGCSWWMQAPRGKVVEIVFDDFSFQEPTTKPPVYMEPLCVYEKVEVRLKDIHNPDIYCGEALKGKKLRSIGRYMVIVIVADRKKLVGRGLKASFQFVK